MDLLSPQKTEFLQEGLKYTQFSSPASVSLDFENSTIQNSFNTTRENIENSSLIASPIHGSPLKYRRPEVTPLHFHENSPRKESLKQQLVEAQKALEESRCKYQNLENEYQSKTVQDAEEIKDWKSKFEGLKDTWENQFVDFKLTQKKQETASDQAQMTIQELNNQNSDLRAQLFRSCVLNSKFNLIISQVPFGHTVRIEDLWEEAQKEEIPTQDYIQFTTQKLIQAAIHNPKPPVQPVKHNTRAPTHATKHNSKASVQPSAKPHNSGPHQKIVKTRTTIASHKI